MFRMSGASDHEEAVISHAYSQQFASLIKIVTLDDDLVMHSEDQHHP